ncbi:MAG: hypothetical protein HC764_25320 [Pleurocapsa sp. CRU_1_2]|nr:hypothetical protein [Pleurocapsa sp. CRU_1_2]
MTKNNSKKQTNQASLEKQLQAMAEDPEIQTEITNIEREFLITEIDGLN